MPAEVAEFAGAVARELPAPAVVYTLDVCETPTGPRLLELNPFGGADLHACDRATVVAAVAEAIGDL